MLKDDVEKDAIKIYGVSGEEGIKKLLNDLYWEKNIPTKDIAERYGSTPPTIRALMRSVGLELRSPGGGVYFKDALKNNGYIDANDFFCRNFSASKTDMAKELGVSFRSLCIHYDKWAENFD